MKSSNLSEVNRRDFLAGGSFATMMMLMGGVPLNAAEDKPALNADGSTNYKAKAVPVNVGVIGCGIWGREILKTLALLPHGPVVAIADTYPAFLKRAGSLAPNAQPYPDVEKLLADPKDTMTINFPESVSPRRRISTRTSCSPRSRPGSTSIARPPWPRRWRMRGPSRPPPRPA